MVSALPMISHDTFSAVIVDVHLKAHEVFIESGTKDVIKNFYESFLTTGWAQKNVYRNYNFKFLQKY